MFYINFYNQNSSFALSNAERKLRYHTKLNEERHEEVKQQNWVRKREKKILPWQRSRKKKDESKKEKGKDFTEKNKFWKLR